VRVAFALKAGVFFVMMFACLGASASAPQVFRTPGYQSPVRGGPDDLLLISGVGFAATDQVVYRTLDDATAGAHPSSVPSSSNADLGVARTVKIGEPAYSITVLLPNELRADRAYRLWVVNAQGQWSSGFSINDPRPLWFSPASVYANRDAGDLGRRIRVIGRNLDSAGAGLEVKLDGPRSYVLRARKSDPQDGALNRYLVEAPLPANLVPGQYTVSISKRARGWAPIPGQTLMVLPDPAQLPLFDVSQPEFGGCRPDDGLDDTECLARAIDAATRAHAGIVTIPPGHWDISADHIRTPHPEEGFVLAANVHLNGAGANASVLVRHAAQSMRAPGALLTLTGNNSISNLTFTDAEAYESLERTRAVIQLGTPRCCGEPTENGPRDVVDNVVISGNIFRRVGRAIVDSGLPISRLLLTRNEFGAYDNALYMTGNRFRLTPPFQIGDSVIRWNRFLPGSFMDLAHRQGTIAAQLGASLRVDFSSNIADGTSIEGLQKPDDPKGFRAAFFWNANNNNEMLLVAGNRILCPGDQVGDGEAIAFDGNGNTLGFNGAQPVNSAGPDWAAVRTALLASQNGQPVDRDYYKGHWIQIVQGPGVGQARRITSVDDSAGGLVKIHVAPRWDVLPSAPLSRIVVAREYWQVYAVANEIDQSSPRCGRSNLSGPNGGGISWWAPSADSTIEGNHQTATNGILFQQSYQVPTPSCRSCGNDAYFHTALEIRSNIIDGEYDWSSDCGGSGILGSFAASDTPESPPPLLGFGTVIAGNVIVHADNVGGGAIDMASTWFRGPPPHDWALVQNPLIFHNRIRDIDGSPPRAVCKHGPHPRIGIRIDGPGNVRDAVLYNNSCENVSRFIDDRGSHTTRLCPVSAAGRCECSAQ
jgi:hypothetical protein